VQIGEVAVVNESEQTDFLIDPVAIDARRELGGVVLVDSLAREVEGRHLHLLVRSHVPVDEFTLVLVPRDIRY